MTLEDDLPTNGSDLPGEPEGRPEDGDEAKEGHPVEGEHGPGTKPVEDDLSFDGLPEIDEEAIAASLDESALDLDEEDIEDDSFEEEDEDGGNSESSEGSTEAPAKPRSKKRKGSDEDEEVEHPDTPVPTPAKMRAALDKAFAGQADIDDRILSLMTKHAIHLLETNRVMNLTAIIDPLEVAVKHYLDSWRITRVIPLVARRILDLGSGGGFPGIPVAIAEPDCSMILCESIGKKARFLEETVALLGLKNVTVAHMRAEDYLATERVDLVFVRAVSSVRENIRTLRKVRHSVKDVVMLKGNSWGREVRAGEREAERLGFKLDTVSEHELPEEMGARAIVVYRAPGGDGM